MARSQGADASGARAAEVAAGSDAGPTVGQLTSGIRNKIARSEAYNRLKKAKKARYSVCVRFAYLSWEGQVGTHLSLQ